MKTLRNKLFFITLIAVILLLTACKAEEVKDITKESADSTLKVGILQLTQHPALDAARIGFEEELENENIEIIYQNAQGSIPNISTIGQKFIRDDLDLIFAISTPVAQGLKNMETDIPIIFTAITDPVSTEIVENMEKPNTNFTGTSDEAPIKEQFELFLELDDTIKTIGVLFSTSELNSQIQLEQIREIANELNLNIEEMGVSNINEIPKATDSLIKKVDAIYTPADNMIASSIQVITEKATASNIITIGAEEAHVEGGALITNGINYKNLGAQSAKMAKDILFNNKDIKNMSVQKSENTELVINQTTLERLNLKISDELLNKSKTIK